MNKKLKILVALCVAIQLFVPSFLLIYHYSLIETSKGLETEYMFELDSFALPYYYENETENLTEFPETPMELDIFGISSWRRGKYAVITTPENHVMSVQAVSGKADSDTWFYGSSFKEIRKISPENYSFRKGVDRQKVITELKYQYMSINLRDRESAYLSAKVYKGVIIPTAIYFKGEKIIDINL